MKKDNRINPIGLKGNEINERMKELMGVSSVNENKSSSVVELTKIGPDGKAYAIVRENHKYFIKSTDKTSGIISEDFKYIGGLQNKTSEAYPSYALAIKNLNLKFNSLAEAFNTGSNINVFKNDNLLTESGIAGFSNMGSGFSNEGNLEGNDPLLESNDDDEDEENDYSGYSTMDENNETMPIYEYFDNPDDKLPSKSDNRWDKEDAEENENDDDLSEAEKAVNNIDKENRRDGLNGKGLPPEPKDVPDPVTEHKLSIARALINMDSIIDNLTEGTLKKKVYTLK